MKFLSVNDVRLFLAEVGEFALAESAEVGVNFEPTEAMLELFIKKRKKLIQRLRDFRHHADGKENWRHNRYKIEKGIRRYERSTRGKRFHRALGRFLATREQLETDPNIYENASALKAIASLKTNAYIVQEYYTNLDDELDYWLLLEYMLPLVSSAEAKILEERVAEITEDEEDILVRMCETAAMVTALANRSGKPREEVEASWEKAKKRVAAEYKRSEDDSGYWALVVGITKRMLGIGKKHEVLQPPTAA